MKIKCDRCGESVVVVYRANGIGVEPALWYCNDCMDEDNKLIDPEVEEITNIITEQ